MKRGKPLQRTPMKRTRKPRNSERGPWRSAAYLEWVRSLPCCIAGISYCVVAHHLLRGTGEKCMGRKSGDNWAIPLCTEAHTALHDIGDETGFLKGHGIDGPALADALHAAWTAGDYEQGLRVVRGHEPTRS